MKQQIGRGYHERAGGKSRECITLNVPKKGTAKGLGFVLSGNLERGQFIALLRKLDGAYNSGKPDFSPFPDEAFSAFMRHCEQRIGEATFRTPRTTITAFIGLLAVLEQNPGDRMAESYRTDNNSD
jgi:hypothetical protein